MNLDSVGPVRSRSWCFILVTLLKSDARTWSHVHLPSQTSEGRVTRVPNRTKSPKRAGTCVTRPSEGGFETDSVRLVLTRIPFVAHSLLNEWKPILADMSVGDRPRAASRFVTVRTFLVMATTMSRQCHRNVHNFRARTLAFCRAHPRVPPTKLMLD